MPYITYGAPAVRLTCLSDFSTKSADLPAMRAVHTQPGLNRFGLGTWVACDRVPVLVSLSRPVRPSDPDDRTHQIYQAQKALPVRPTTHLSWVHYLLVFNCHVEYQFASRLVNTDFVVAYATIFVWLNATTFFWMLFKLCHFMAGYFHCHRIVWRSESLNRQQW